MNELVSAWVAAQQRAPGSLLLFRQGETYTAIGDDAVLLSKLCKLDLRKIATFRLVSVPLADLKCVLGRLLQDGHKVAIVDVDVA
mgnify:CR=1 FL=1